MESKGVADKFNFCDGWFAEQGKPANQRRDAFARTPCRITLKGG